MSFSLGMLVPPFVDIDFRSITFDPRVTVTRSSTGTRYNAAGALAVVAIDTPRIDYDPATLAVSGLLVEAQATNLLLRSEEFDNASWAASGSAGTVTANAAIAPDGTTTADKIVEAASLAYHSRRQSVGGLTELTTYTLSFFAKPAGRTRVRCHSYIGGYTSAYMFDLAAGTAPPGCSITQIANGWYRCTAPVTTVAGQSARIISIGPADDVVTNTQTYTGDGVSGVYVWGAQIEVGATATSYIPTTTAAVTRAADVASFTIPARVVRLVTIYSDGTTASQTVTPGATYNIPTGTKPILRIRGYYV